jgi:hypothetical protein
MIPIKDENEHRQTTAIISLIFQLNAYCTIEYIYLLPTLSCMFPCVLHHPQGEICITYLNYVFYKVNNNNNNIY